MKAHRKEKARINYTSNRFNCGRRIWDERSEKNEKEEKKSGQGRLKGVERQVGKGTDCGALLSILEQGFRLRDAFPFQNGWIFGKVPNGLWPPPLIFGKSCCAFRDKIATKVRMFIMAGLLCIIWSYFPWDACSTTVQHGNWLKTYPKKTLLYHFHAEKALFKGPNFAI